MKRWQTWLVIAGSVLAQACGHLGTSSVTRRLGELQFQGPAYPAIAWEAALILELEAVGVSNPTTTSQQAMALNAEDAVTVSQLDPHVIAVALTRHGDNPFVVAAAAHASRDSQDCELQIAHALSLPDAAATLERLAAQCPRALIPAIRLALDGGELDDRATAVALATIGATSTDREMQQLVLDAFTIAENSDSVERFVAQHQADPVFTSSVVLRARATNLPNLRAAMLAPLAGVSNRALESISALLDANRIDDARAALRAATPDTIDDRLGLAELAIRANLPELAVGWSESSFEDGASTRALAIRAAALDGLGRHSEAASQRRALVSGTAGALASEP